MDRVFRPDMEAMAMGRASAYDPMPAISLMEPHGSFVRYGLKPIETRVWGTNYRGPVLVCTSKRLDRKAAAQSPALLKLYAAGGRLIYGHAICVAHLRHCEPMRKEHEERACIAVYPGAWAWHFDLIEEIEPFPVRGALKLFDPKLSLRGINLAMTGKKFTFDLGLTV